jgi:hypothetical protein
MTEQQDWEWTPDASILQHTTQPAYQLHTAFPEDPNGARRYVLVNTRIRAAWEIVTAGASRTAGDIAAEFVRTGQPTPEILALGVTR